MNWGAVVLAGGTADAELAEVIGSRRKALAKVGGRTCLHRTLEAVQRADLSRCVTVGPPEVRPEVFYGDWVEEHERQMSNARAGVEAMPGIDRLLFLPSDSPFLEPDGLRAFLAGVDRRADGDRWLAVGLCSESEFRAEYPEVPTKPIRMKEGRFLSGAYYATSRAAFFTAVETLTTMSDSRKSQLRMVWRFGVATLLKFATGSITLAEGERKVSRLLQGQAFGVLGCDPHGMVDIDTIEDFRAVQEIAARRRE